MTFGDVVVTPAGRLLVAVGGRDNARVFASSESARARRLSYRPSAARVSAGDCRVRDDGPAIVAWSQQVPSRRYSEQAVAATRAAHEAGFGARVALGPAAALSLAVGLTAGRGALVAWSDRVGPARSPGEVAVTRLH